MPKKDFYTEFGKKLSVGARIGSDANLLRLRKAAEKEMGINRRIIDMEESDRQRKLDLDEVTNETKRVEEKEFQTFENSHNAFHTQVDKDLELEGSQRETIMTLLEKQTPEHLEAARNTYDNIKTSASKLADEDRKHQRDLEKKKPIEPIDAEEGLKGINDIIADAKKYLSNKEKEVNQLTQTFIEENGFKKEEALQMARDMSGVTGVVRNDIVKYLEGPGRFENPKAVDSLLAAHNLLFNKDGVNREDATINITISKQTPKGIEKTLPDKPGEQLVSPDEENRIKTLIDKYEAMIKKMEDELEG